MISLMIISSNRHFLVRQVRLPILPSDTFFQDVSVSASERKFSGFQSGEIHPGTSASGSIMGIRSCIQKRLSAGARVRITKVGSPFSIR